MTDFLAVAKTVAAARVAGVAVLAQTDGRVYHYARDIDQEGFIPVEYLAEMGAHAATNPARDEFRSKIQEYSFELINARPVAAGWGVYFGDCPCEAYAMVDGVTITGDMDDITEYVRAGVAFKTYEGFATEEEARQSAGEEYTVRPLPAGTVFFDRDGRACVVSADAPASAVPSQGLDRESAFAIELQFSPINFTTASAVMSAFIVATVNPNRAPWRMSETDRLSHATEAGIVFG